jgi:hypothetical protein
VARTESRNKTGGGVVVFLLWSDGQRVSWPRCDMSESLMGRYKDDILIRIIGLERGYYQPTSYFITDLMRMQSRGAVPGNNVFMDVIWWFISGVSGRTDFGAQ